LGVDGLPSGKAAFDSVGEVALNIEYEVLIPATRLHPDEYPNASRHRYTIDYDSF
jgi:hypothetical protein